MVSVDIVSGCGSGVGTGVIVGWETLVPSLGFEGGVEREG